MRVALFIDLRLPKYSFYVLWTKYGFFATVEIKRNCAAFISWLYMYRKRILILTNRVPYPLNDGGNLAMHAMIQGYKQQGWEVYLLSMNTSRHKVEDTVLSTIYTDLYAFETVDVDNSITIAGAVKNLLFSKEPEHAARFYKQAFADKLTAVLKQFQPDAVQVESVFLSSYLPLIKQHSHAKTILRLHNIEWQIWQRLAMQTGNPIKRVYLQTLSQRMQRYEAQVWKQYDLLLPITEVDAAMVKQHADTAQALTIPFGIAVNTIKQDNVAEWAGYHIGAMDWLPNQQAIDWFIGEVWPLIKQKQPDFTFHFAGRHMPRRYFDVQADGITCAGEVADAAAFIADKKILLVPLLSGGGIRVKTLEAMAAGKLVISTTIGMQGISAVAGTHYLLADTPQAFADAVDAALSNKAQATAIGHAAAALIRDEYDAAALAATLSQKVEALLSR
jgi:polysaccharide biosynthesis protein PslH